MSGLAANPPTFSAKHLLEDSSRLAKVSGIALDAAGNVYTASRQTNLVYRWNAASAFSPSLFAGPFIDSPEQLLSAADLGPGATLVLGSLAPASASVKKGDTAKFELVVGNDTAATAAQVGIALVAGPKGLGVSYKPKGGSKNTPVDIAAGASQEFAVEMTPSTTFHRTSIVLAFGGPSTPPSCPVLVQLTSTR